MFGIYDDLTPDHVPGLQKYDMCMTEQVPGPQGVKIVGRHMSSAPYHHVHFMLAGRSSSKADNIIIGIHKIRIYAAAHFPSCA